MLILALWECKQKIFWLRILPDISELSQQCINIKKTYQFWQKGYRVYVYKMEKKVST